MRRLVALAVILLAACGDESPRIASAHDGDSFVLTDGRRLRLEGVDTPELAGKCQAEKDLARRARSFVTTALDEKGYRVVLSGKREKYGRELGRIEIDGRFDLGELLITAGLARPYSGRGPRGGWCS